MLVKLAATRLVVDGELVIEIDGQLSFEALQMRLHPADTRIRMLAQKTPFRFILFDMLQTPDGAVIIDQPLSERRRTLENLVRDAGEPNLSISPATLDRHVAENWLTHLQQFVDGVVAKRLDDAYQPAKRAMIKCKRRRTADCVIGGFRYATGTQQVGSLLLGLYNAAGKLDHVGFTSAISAADRPALTRKLEELREAPGFTCKAPGAPSRWSAEARTEWEPVAPKLVAEVSFDHVTGMRFRHGTKLIRWRPDKAHRQCTYEQISV